MASSNVWWNKFWDHRKKLCINGGDSYVSGVHYLHFEQDLQTLRSNGLLSQDYSDIRIIFQDTSRAINVPYYIASGCSPEKIYFPAMNNIPSGISQSASSGDWAYYFYYNNPLGKNQELPPKYNNYNFPQAPYAAFSDFTTFARSGSYGSFRDKCLYRFNDDPSLGNVDLFHDSDNHTYGVANVSGGINKGYSGILDQASFFTDIYNNGLSVELLSNNYYTHPSGDWCIDLWLKPSGNLYDRNWFFTKASSGNNRQLALGLYDGTKELIYYTPGAVGEEKFGGSGGYLEHIDSDDHGGQGWQTWGQNDYIFLANHSDGLLSYSSQSGNLQYIDKHSTGHDVLGVWGDQQFIYTAEYFGGLHSYSVDVSGNLTHIDSHDPGDRAYFVWGDGNFVYLANFTGGLHSYSVDASGYLTHIDSDVPGEAMGVWGDSNFVYVAYRYNGIYSYSVDASGYLTQIDSHDPGSLCLAVFADENFVYLANYDGGLHTYSVDASGYFTHIDNVDPGGFGYGVWGDGSYVYLCNYHFGIYSYYVDSSGHLSYRDHDDQGGYAMGAWGDEHFLYLANHENGIHSYNRSWNGEIGFVSGVWQHLRICTNVLGQSDYVNTYRNGKLVGQAGPWGPVNNINSSGFFPTIIGGAVGFDPNNSFDGWIEQFRFSNYPKFKSDPSPDWIDNQSTVTTCTDESIGSHSNFVDIGCVAITRNSIQNSGVIGGYISTNAEYSASGSIGAIVSTDATPSSGNIGLVIRLVGDEDILTIGGYLLTFKLTDKQGPIGGIIKTVAGAPSESIGGFLLNTWAEKDYTAVENLSRVLIKGKDYIVPQQECGMEAGYILYKNINDDVDATIKVSKTKYASFDANLEVQKKHRVPDVAITNVSTSGNFVTITASGLAYNHNNAPINSGIQDAIFTWTDGDIDKFDNVQNIYTATHMYAKSGLYKPSVKMSDKYGEYGSDYTAINLASGLSFGYISLSGIPRAGLSPLVVDFHVELSGVNGTYDIFWDYNNGIFNYNNALNTTIQYSMPGNYCPYVRLEQKNVYIVDTLKIGFNK